MAISGRANGNREILGDITVIVAAVAWLAIIVTALGYAQIFRGQRRPGAAAETPVELHVCDVSFGLLILAGFLFAASMFARLTPLVGASIAGPGFAAALLSPKLTSGLRRRSWLLLASLPVAWFVSSREVKFYDTALYHQQAVKWLSTFGLVRGVALIHFRLGFLSSWFALAAVFNHGLLAGRVPAITGGISSGLIIYAACSPLPRWISGSRSSVRSPSWMALSCMLLAVICYWNLAVSLSPDMIAWILPTTVVTYLTDESASRADRVGGAALLSALGCLTKLSLAPALGYTVILAVFYFIRGEQRVRLACWMAGALFTMGLLFAANLVASGCLVFPSPAGCLASEWSVPSATAAHVRDLISQYPSSQGLITREVLPLTGCAIAGALIALWRRRSSPFGPARTSGVFHRDCLRFDSSATAALFARLLPYAGRYRGGGALGRAYGRHASADIDSASASLAKLWPGRLRYGRRRRIRRFGDSGRRVSGLPLSEADGGLHGRPRICREPQYKQAVGVVNFSRGSRRGRDVQAGRLRPMLGCGFAVCAGGRYAAHQAS